MSSRQLPAQPLQTNKPPPNEGYPANSLSRLPVLVMQKPSQLMPGSLVVRPTRKDVERNVNAFYILVDDLRFKHVLPSKDIARIIGDKTQSFQSNISRKIRERSFSPGERRNIARAIFEDQLTVSGHTRARLRAHPDAFYFSLLEFMNIQETSQDKARALATGTYKFWRHSFDHEGEFVFGRVDIFEDTTSYALKVVMNQHKKGYAGVPEAHERFEGYFFRLADSYIMFLHDPENEDFRSTHFTSHKIGSVGICNPGKPNSVFAGKRDHLIYLRGFVSGTDCNKGLFSPVEMVLVEDTDELMNLDDQLDVIGSGDPRLPPRVEAYLNRQGKMQRF